jgi:hypothetical protein
MFVRLTNGNFGPELLHSYATGIVMADTASRILLYILAAHRYPGKAGLN